MPREVHGVILDVDGTLVDSNAAHAEAWHAALADAGYAVPTAKLQRLIGMGSDKLLPAAIGVAKDSAQGKALTDARKAIFRERYLPWLKPTPGARDLLVQLKRDGLRMVVASSAEGDELRALLDICGATELIDDVTAASEVPRSKPEPDVVQVALDKLRLPVDEAIMLGDTPYDIEAATRAHIGTIGVRCGGWRDADLAGALAIYEDPADLLAHYAGSPLARTTA